MGPRPDDCLRRWLRGEDGALQEWLEGVEPYRRAARELLFQLAERDRLLRERDEELRRWRVRIRTLQEEVLALARVRRVP